MSHIDIHPRIEQRHPEIKPQDVYDAVRGMVSYTRRESGEWVGVGFDTQSSSFMSTMRISTASLSTTR